MNKADYISLINTNLPDGGNIPSADHRATMHTNANSIGELVYGDVIEETQISGSILSAAADFDYVIQIMKVGRQIHMTGTVRNTGSSARVAIINIDDNDYKCVEDKTFYGNAFYGNGSSPSWCSVQNQTTPLALSRLRFNGVIFPEEVVNFNITFGSNL